MSFGVAVQSAIFYLVACTPCTQVLHRQRAKQQAKREREEKARWIPEEGQYQHPDPFSTNQHWMEEIMMGPSLTKKTHKPKGDGVSSKNANQRGASRGSDGSSSASVAAQRRAGGGREAAAGGGGGQSPSAVAQNGNAATIPSTPRGPIVIPPPSDGAGISPTAAALREDESMTLTNTASVSTGDDWNRKRYQREDEELWGNDTGVYSWGLGGAGGWSTQQGTGHKLMDAIKQAGSSAGRFVESKLGIEKPATTEDRYKFYQTYLRAPPVNDFHPPVVSSKPAHKAAHRWMLQPPPPAKVMEGKVPPVTRCGSRASFASRRTVSGAGSDAPGAALGRIVGEKAVEARIRKGEMPDEADQLGLGPHSAGSLRNGANGRTRPRRMATGSSRGTARGSSHRTARSLSVSADSEDGDDESDGSACGASQTRRRRRGDSAKAQQRQSSLQSARSQQQQQQQQRWQQQALAGSGDNDSDWDSVPRSLGSSPSASGAVLLSQQHAPIPSHAAQRPRLATIMSSDVAAEAGLAGSVDAAMSLGLASPGEQGGGHLSAASAALREVTNTSLAAAGEEEGEEGIRIRGAAKSHRDTTDSAIDSGLELQA